MQTLGRTGFLALPSRAGQVGLGCEPLASFHPGAARPGRLALGIGLQAWDSSRPAGGSVSREPHLSADDQVAALGEACPAAWLPLPSLPEPCLCRHGNGGIKVLSDRPAGRKGPGRAPGWGIWAGVPAPGQEGETEAAWWPREPGKPLQPNVVFLVPLYWAGPGFWKPQNPCGSGSRGPFGLKC